jgi:hypothetical protein
MDDLAYCQRRVAEYEAFRGEALFNEEKLIAMRGGCSRRQELGSPELGAEQKRLLRDLIRNERPDLWSLWS